MANPAMNERIAKRTVLGRPGEPQDVANAIRGGVMDAARGTLYDRSETKSQCLADDIATGEVHDRGDHGLGLNLVVHNAVVQRAVRLDVPNVGAGLSQSCELPGESCAKFVKSGLKVAAAEVLAVVI